MSREFIIKIHKLKSMLKSRATGEFNYDETEYQLIRNEIIADQKLTPYIPNFLVFSENLDSFWYYIKEKFTTYNERRKYLEQSFTPILNYLETGIVPENNEGLSKQGINIMTLKLMLGSLATGGSNYNENKYQLIRNEIIADQKLTPYIPDFLVFSENLDSFWYFIKEKFGTYKERREYLKMAFEPVFIYLNQFSEPAQNSIPVQNPVSHSQIPQQPLQQPRQQQLQPHQVPANPQLQYYPYPATQQPFYYYPQPVQHQIPHQPHQPHQSQQIYTHPLQQAVPPTNQPSQTPMQPMYVQEEVIEKEKHVYEYDVALSFAGEDRDVVEEIAMELISNDISVFYDEFQKANLWGKKLSHNFKETYGTNTHFVIVFISKHYALKDWTDFEFSIARKEAKTRKSEFILPIRIDDTNIVGLHNDVAYLDLNRENVKSIVETISEKLKT